MQTASNFRAAELLLGFLRNANIRACICGGYVRDSLLSRPVRDIDLYIDNYQYIKAMSLLTESNEIPASSDNTEEYIHQSIERQAEYKLGANLVEAFRLPTDIVNIIGIKEIFLSSEEITERYNLGICMAGLSLHKKRLNGPLTDMSELKLHTDARFIKDVTDHTITIYRQDWGIEATERQIAKLLADKYAGWTAKRPESNDSFEAWEG